MVATRRGTRVGSPVKNTNDENSGATQPTPSTRSTRRRTLMEENQSQSDSQPDEAKDDSAASSLASPPKRDTRRSTRALANKKQPDSTHDEADVSESESCCSVASDAPATPRTRRRTAVRGKRAVQDEVSEAESCSSAVSATRCRTAPRSLRKRVLTSVALKDEDAKDDEEASEVDSCSSAVSLTKGMDTRRVTRSHRKAYVPTTDADQSEPESCSSSVSGLRSSTVRRSTRNPRVKVTEPIPLSLEETTDAPSSPVSKSLRSRSRKTGVEDVEYDSEGCKSGPSMSPWRSTRRQRKVVGESDSESVATDVCASHGSPSPQRGKGTPCSSRTGSASSNRAVPVTRTRSRAKVSSDVSDTDAAKPEEQKESDKHSSIPELEGSKDEEVDQLDSTMTMDTSEVQECTIIEEKAEDTTVVLDQDESFEKLEAQTCTQDVQLVEDQELLQGETVAENSGKQSEDIEPKDIPEERKSEVVEDSVSDDAEKVVVDQQDVQVVEDHETEKLQEEPVAENSGTVSEDKELKDSAMERELEIVETSHDVEEKIIETVPEDSLPDDVEKVVEDLVESAPEDQAPAVVEEKVESEQKGVIVTEEAVEMTEDDLEGPSTSSHTVAETSQAAPLQKETISLLDSSEDEESADEGLSSEGEGRSQEAEDDQSEDDVMCPDEDRMAEAHGNGLFVIDTKPGLRAEEQYFVDAKQTEEEDEEDFVDEEGDEDDDEDSKVLFAPKKPLMQLSSSIDTGLKMKELGGLYISFDGNKPKTLSSCSKTQKDPGSQDEVLKKSVIVPDFEKKDAVPPYKESRNATKLKRKAEREKTTGDGWFNMRAPELTEELKNDLKALKMRSAMDPKRFYKKNDREGFPKYFQVGTVVDSPVDFYTSRIPKKQRKKTIVEELLADAEFRSYNKRKYQEIMTEKAAQAAGKHNKKQKFHKKKTNKS